jgi:CheY-like chemotaxis protein
MNHRLLIVEDNPLNRELLCDWLDTEGFERLRKSARLRLATSRQRGSETVREHDKCHTAIGQCLVQTQRVFCEYILIYAVLSTHLGASSGVPRAPVVDFVAVRSSGINKVQQLMEKQRLTPKGLQRVEHLVPNQVK